MQTYNLFVGCPLPQIISPNIVLMYSGICHFMLLSPINYYNINQGCFQHLTSVSESRREVYKVFSVFTFEKNISIKFVDFFTFL